MKQSRKNPLRQLLDKIPPELWTLPWLELLFQGWQFVQMLLKPTPMRGMYEVLEYESLLDLQDAHGRSASFSKREKVRYLQNHIIAYQDHAWGDGDILLNYRCAPGVVVDRYRPGQKTFLLISLRENKQRDDVDEFHISWDLRNGFVRKAEMWETEVRHLTRVMRIRVRFPKSRPPHRFWLVEHLAGKRSRLAQESLRRLQNGRFQLTYVIEQPRLNERYQLHWEW